MNAFIFLYVYHRSLLFVSSVSTTVACRTGPFFSLFSDEHQEGVEAIGETSAAGKSGTPASRMSEKRVAPVCRLVQLVLCTFQLNLKPDFLIIIWIVSVASIFSLGRCNPKYVSQPIYRGWFCAED